MHASNAARYEQSFRDIADCIKLAGRQDPQANILKLMHDWLRNCQHPWLLVLDNVDDARFLLDHSAAYSKTASKPLREYLPQCKCSSILITTRNKEAALSGNIVLVGHRLIEDVKMKSKEAALRLVEQRDIVSVELMDDAQAQVLFKKKLISQGDSSDVAKLAATIEYMPLAIVQAAAYMT